MKLDPTPPLVSIVIPTFNQSVYLPACIDHCLFQTYPEIELIIVDGGSADDTKIYLNQIQEKITSETIQPVVQMDVQNQIVRESKLVYPQNRNIEIVTFDRDIGATPTYNEGLKRANGKYVTYIVGDDLPHPHMIEEMVHVLESTENDFVYSDMNLINDENHIIRQFRLPEYSFKSCFADWFHLGVSKLYRTDLHRTVGLMDQTYQFANDYDHYLRFAMAGASFFHLPEVLYSIRYHGKNRKTGQHTPERYIQLINESKKCANRAREWQRKLENQEQVHHART